MRTFSFTCHSIVAIALMAGAGLANASGKDEFESQAQQLRAGPASAPATNGTAFTQGLRCMDRLLRTYGIRDVKVLIDEIPDATKKLNVGARDMFITATSELARTSHAIQLVEVPGTVLLQLIPQSSRASLVSGADYVVQGSISQFDDSMLQKQRDGAVCIWYLCLGGASSDSFSALGLDLNLADSAHWSVVPGASVRNAVLIRKRGKGLDGDFTIKQYSIQYDYTFTSSESNGQALRTLIELGAIQLYGRLLRVPYWTCMGASDSDPEVRSEINDWWEELAGDEADRGRLLGYLQMQMRNQDVYDGPVDGKSNPELLRAVRAYKLAMGLPDSPTVDGGFLRAYLSADHARTREAAARQLAELPLDGPQPMAPLAAAKAPLPGPAPAGAPAPARADSPPSPLHADRILIRATLPADHIAYRAGEAFSVAAFLPEDGYLYCFETDGGPRLTQFYPAAGQDLERLHASLNVLNAKSPLLAPHRGQRKSLVCLLSRTNLGRQPFGSADVEAAEPELESRFSAMAQGTFEKGVFDVHVQ